MLYCTLRLMLHGQLVMTMIISHFLPDLWDILFSLLMHSSALVFIELHSVSDYFFTKLLFLRYLWSCMILLGLNFFISKIKDFEWINSWDTVYLQSTKFSELELNPIFNSLMSLSDFKNMFCSLSSRHLMRRQHQTQINSSKTPFVTFCWVDTNALGPSPLLIYILCKCFQFGGDICLSMFTKFLKQINFIFCIFTFVKNFPSSNWWAYKSILYITFRL